MSTAAPLSQTNQSQLADPVTCGEDHLHNLALVTQIAGKYCGACEDYHVTTSANRLTGRSGWNRVARPALIGFVRGFLSAPARDAGKPIDIVIAGSADTSVLATCAHAAFAAGPATRQRVRFTVLDGCPTPLELCRDYAGRHGVRLETATADFTGPMPNFSADLVVIHGVLTFLPASRHVSFLRQCAQWLKPEGRMFLWGSLFEVNGPRDRADRALISQKMRTLIETGLKSGLVKLNEPPEKFYARLDRIVDKQRDGATRIAALEPFKALLSATGLPILSVRPVDYARDMPDGKPLNRQHVEAVLGPPSS